MTRLIASIKDIGVRTLEGYSAIKILEHLFVFFSLINQFLTIFFDIELTQNKKVN